jgi:hypothetical protein
VFVEVQSELLKAVFDLRLILKVKGTAQTPANHVSNKLNQLSDGLSFSSGIGPIELD